MNAITSRLLRYRCSIDRYVLVALIAIEALACYNFYCREIAWYPPGNWDQSACLAVAYRTKERILTNGFGQLANIVKSAYKTGVAQVRRFGLLSPCVMVFTKVKTDA
jgi:hypothetical protein